MATKKTAPKKAVKPVKKAAPVKKSAPVKKAAPAKKASAPVKKAAPAKKSVPVKKAAPAKAATAPKKATAVKPSAKAAPAKKQVLPAQKASVAKAVPAKSKPVAKAPAKPAAPSKQAVKTASKAPVKAAPAKAAPAKSAPASKKPVPAKAPAKAAPAKATPVKAAPAKSAPAASSAKGNSAKAAPAKPAPAKAVPVKAAPAKPADKKKVPQISPETRFAQTSSTVASAADIRKALRAKEAKKDQKPVVIPKITSKTAKKYEPEFTRSVLDQKEVVAAETGPTQRYSDVELSEFRELVTSKLNAAKQELTYLNGLITRKDSMSGEDSDSRYMTMEDGSLSMEREQLSQMASRQIDFIEKLEKALMRIENKTYGICRVTGKLIDKARLRAVPHATLSMEAKLNMNRPGGGSQNQG